MISIKLLFSKGVHFGHQTSRGNPKMKPYLWGQKNKIHIIDVSKTAMQIEKAASFLRDLTAQGKDVLWCGTKKPASEAIISAGEATKSPRAAHRWIGGTLTNSAQVRKSITNLLHLEDVLEKEKEKGGHYTKKELGVFQKQVARATRNVGGLRTLRMPIGALIVVDARKEKVAIKEAIAQRVPIVALVDTNSDPSGISFVIPTNDDSPLAISLIIEYLVVAVQEGKKLFNERAVQEQAAGQSKDKEVTGVVGEEENLLATQLSAVEAALGGEDRSKAATSGSRKPAGGARFSADRRPAAQRSTPRPPKK